MSAKIDEFVAAEGLSGAGLVVVDRKDGVIGEYYTGNITADRISLVASASKSLTAGVVMRLEDQGVLDIDKPIADYVDWGSAHPEITLAQLMSNSSGLPGLEDGSASAPYICQYVAAGSMQDCARTVFLSPDDDAEIMPPDTEFRYGGAQWQVAGAVAEVASGKSWAQLVDETYTQPCGLSTLGYNNHYTQMIAPEGPFTYPPQFDGNPAGLAATENPNMEGGAYISPTDYAQLLLMQLRGGKCNEQQVISAEAIDRMQADRIGPAYKGSTGDPQGADALLGYGLGWWVDRDNPAYVEDSGAFGAVPWIDRERGYAAYLIVEKRYIDGAKLSEAVLPLITEEVDNRN
ncbi:MAG: serine hydrolase domain-containing protein [Microthrixaceae bacterium]